MLDYACTNKTVSEAKMLKETILKYYDEGCSCAESVIRGAVEEGLCDKSLIPCASSFRGGMGSGCVCGAVAISQMIVGYQFGDENKFGNNNDAILKTQEFIQKFKGINKVTCCKVLSKGLEGQQRRANCRKLVSDAAEILENIIKIKENV